MASKFSQLLLIFLYQINNCHSYNWQQHIPNTAKVFIKENCTLDSSTSNGGNSLTGKINLSNHYGPLIFNYAEIESDLSVFGPLTSNNTHYKGKLTCYGPVELGSNNIFYNDVLIMGSLTTNNSLFESAITIFGYLYSQNSQFKNLITIHTSKIELHNTKICNLIIKDKDCNPAEIILDNVQLEGKIEIASGKGTVVIKNSKISSGKILGYKKLVQN